MTDELVKLLRAQLQAKEDGLNVRDRRIEAQAAEIARLREALGDLIKQCWSCEKELTEEYYGTHYSGESLPLCNARAALGGNDE